MGELQPIYYNGDRFSVPDGYVYSETIADGVTSEPVKLHRYRGMADNISLALIAGTGTGKFQYTLDADEMIDVDTAVWYDWDKGDNTGTTVDALISSVSAVRGVSTSGEITFKIKG